MRTASLTSWLLAAVACGGATAQGDQRTPTTIVQQDHRERCASLDREVDLFGWDASSTRALALAAERSVVVVRLQRTGPCSISLEVLPACTTRKALYGYAPYGETRQVLAQDTASLEASLPLGAHALAANLARGKGVRVDYRLAGVQRLPVGTTVERADLSGSCEGATHVVTAIHRGAYAISAGESASLEVLRQEGREQGCVGAAGLVDGCDTPFRVELAALPDKDPRELALPPPRTDRPWARPGPALTYPPNSRCPTGMVEIAGGTFIMGAKTGLPVQRPEHEVDVKTFCLDKTEVTAEAYQACMDASSCGAWREYPGRLYPKCVDPKRGQGNHPRNCVDHDNAADYCAWVGKRLPTEQEWEYAAKAGSRQLKYPWGNASSSRSVACIDRDRHKDVSCPVASLPLEPSGVYDLGGNLTEIVDGTYEPYPGSTFRGESRRVCRGGSFWTEKPAWLESSFRSVVACNSQSTGFRCAL